MINKKPDVSDQIKYITDGYSRFRSKYLKNYNNIFKNLKTGQNPKTLVIGCSDSRVDPAIIMDCEPGDLFVIRNVANLAPPYESGDKKYHGTSAALEFGVCTLNVRNIIVLGHSMCGGINSLFEDRRTVENREFINKWMEDLINLKDHPEICNEEDISKKADKCSKLSIIKSLDNLKTFPWIKERLDKKEILIHGWYFDINNGRIAAYEDSINDFMDL